MKRILLFALIFIYCFSNCNSQNLIDRLSRIEKDKNLTLSSLHNISSILDHTGKSEQLYRSGTNVVFLLDSLYGYEWNPTKRSWTKKHYIQYTYDKAWNVLEMDFQFGDFAESELEYRFRALHTHDRNNNLIESLNQTWDIDKHEWNNSYKNEYLRNTAGSIIEDLYQVWDEDRKVWRNEYRDTMSYKVNNTRLEWVREKWDAESSEWEKYFKNTCTYVQDLLKRELVFLWDNENEWQNDQRINYTHDTLGNRTSQIWENWIPDNNRWTYYWRHSYKYDEYNNEVEHVIQDWVSNSWLNFHRFEFHYLDSVTLSEVLEQRWKSTKSAWENFIHNTFEHDINKNMIEDYLFLWDEGKKKWNNMQWFHSYYSEHSTASKSEDEFNTVKIYPNPFSTSINIEYSLSKPQYHTISIFDISGKQVFLEKEFNNQGNHQINWDATGYPEGIYFLKLVSSEKITVKKLILNK